MLRRSFLFISIIMVLSVTGCLKETYDMNKLSDKMHLTPAFGISAIKGDVSLSDIRKSDDTLIYDQNNFVKIVFKKDSVIDLKMSDFYNLNNMVSFSQSYPIGDLSLAPFQGTIDYTLNQIIQYFSTPLKNQFTLLNDGFPHPFPPFPSTSLGERTFSPFTNFENAIFSSGFIDVSIKNNLSAPLKSINVQLFNTSGHTAIGSTVTIPAIPSGQTQTVSIDLTDKVVTNSIIASIVLSGSDGNTTPAVINLNTSNIQVTVRGRDLKIKSGRVVIQPQTITSSNTMDTVTFDPGIGVELDEIKITSGNFSYHVQSQATLGAVIIITIPTALRNGTPISEFINIAAASHFDGAINLDNSIIDLGADPTHPYNRLPLVYSMDVSSNNLMINFNRDDNVQLDLKMLNPVFDYAKGYFGQQSETIVPKSLNLGIEDILRKITGDFLFSNPSIKFNYSNSFAIPIQINLNATGLKKDKTVNLNLAPFNIGYPAAIVNRDTSAFKIIDKNNSSLPALISMPPEEIRISGIAVMNPSGNNFKRDNYIFSNSRFLGSFEVEVPMELRINNLQFTDTLDNFMKGGDSNIKPEDFKSLHVDLTAKNGFPLGVSLKMSLYDSFSQAIKSTVNATGILEPAPVDSNGKAIGATETVTIIEFTREFFGSINKADKIIFQFTMNTTGNGTQDIKIYSDYRIDFKVAMVVKPDIKLK